MQAARGTSLSDENDATPESPATTHRSGHLRLRFAAIALVVYLVDLGTKIVAVDELADRDVALIGDFLVLHLTRNPGAAFSTGTQFTEVLSVIAIVALVVVLWLSRRLGSAGWATAFGFLLAGVAGNLTDRIFREPGPLRGHVIDFLMLPNWPVFNVADVAINVAAGLILVQAFRGIRIDGTREGADESQQPEPEANHT